MARGVARRDCARRQGGVAWRYSARRRCTSCVGAHVHMCMRVPCILLQRTLFGERDLFAGGECTCSVYAITRS